MRHSCTVSLDGLWCGAVHDNVDNVLISPIYDDGAADYVLIWAILMGNLVVLGSILWSLLSFVVRNKHSFVALGVSTSKVFIKGNVFKVRVSLWSLSASNWFFAKLDELVNYIVKLMLEYVHRE
ncbi:hypothetical protein Tco_0300397 [Tanacetum coccineum]